MQVKRYVIVLFLGLNMLSSHASIFAQEADLDILGVSVVKASQQTTLYPQSRLFGGLVFCQDEGNIVYRYNSRELHELLSQTPKGKIYIEEFTQKRRIAAPFSILSSTLLLTDVVWYMRDPDSVKEQPVLFWGNLVVSIALSVVAKHFDIRSGNSFLLAVQEYNKYQ